MALGSRNNFFTKYFSLLNVKGANLKFKMSRMDDPHKITYFVLTSSLARPQNGKIENSPVKLEKYISTFNRIVLSTIKLKSIKTIYIMPYRYL